MPVRQSPQRFYPLWPVGPLLKSSRLSDPSAPPRKNGMLSKVVTSNISFGILMLSFHGSTFSWAGRCVCSLMAQCFANVPLLTQEARKGAAAKKVYYGKEKKSVGNLGIETVRNLTERPSSTVLKNRHHDLQSGHERGTCVCNDAKLFGFTKICCPDVDRSYTTQI
jgi:hypothetical protein